MPLWSRIILLAAAALALGCNSNSDTALSFYEQSPSESPTEEFHQELILSVDDALEIFDAANLSLAENKSRSAAVKVVRPLKNGHGSGTYLKMHGRFVVVTAAHVVGSATTMFIDGRDNERVVGSLVYIY